MSISESLIIAALRNNLVTGFVEGKDIEKLPDGFCQHNTRLKLFHDHYINVTDKWTKSNPSIGSTIISIVHQPPNSPPDLSPDNIWGMNYYDHYNLNDFITRSQVLDFLREAITALDASEVEQAFIPLRGKHQFNKDFGSGYLSYEICNNPYNPNPLSFSLAKFSIIEKIFYHHVAANKKISTIYTIFEFQAHGGLLSPRHFIDKR